MAEEASECKGNDDDDDDDDADKLDHVAYDELDAIT